MTTTGELAASTVAIVGSLLFWANPKRKVNRAVFASSAVVGAWLAFTQMAASHPERGLYWVRWTSAAGGLAPVTLWMVKESIVGSFEFKNRRWLQRNSSWFVSSILLAIIPFTEIFIPSYSTDANRVYGAGYWLYYALIAFLYGKLIWDSIHALKSVSGGRRLELQIWLCGGSLIAILIYVFIGLGKLTHDPIYRNLQPIAVLIFYAATAYAITSNRIFDARQILLVGLEKIALIVAASLVAYFTSEFFGAILSGTSTLVLTTAIVITVAGWFNGWLDRKLQFVPEGGAARQAAFATAQRETRAETLQSSFTTLLNNWGHTEHSVILSGSKSSLLGAGIELSGESVEVLMMKSLRWATPERLSRERQSSERQAVAKFMSDHGLGVVVFEQGPSLSILVGVGTAASRRPYTYPQVTQLMELASIIQGALERAHFSTKAQQAEQLATVGLLGASVAHEIRNPLVSIKTFVQLLPTHYHDQKFRDKFFRLIGDEIARIDQLTEQLLDLASPRAYSAQLIELHSLLQTGLDLVAAKAAHRQVELITDFKAKPDRAYTDASAAKQVMLNLCFNAIQAVESHGSGERWVKIATRNLDLGIEMTVADSGPGIAPEIWPRLFQPFQTTKSTGFGLGLAICSDILNNLNATITVDPPQPGHGAIFRVTFPCQPLSS